MTRAALAMLLRYPNQEVPVPVSSRLRTLIAELPGTANVIRTRHGYLLHINANLIDIHEGEHAHPPTLDPERYHELRDQVLSGARREEEGDEGVVPSGSGDGVLTATKTMSVSMYVSDERVHSDIEAAVEALLARSGLTLVERDDPIQGSWFRRAWASELSATAAHAVDSRLVLAHDAQVTATMLQNPGPVLTALQPTREAVVRLGAVLIVKLDDQLIVHQLTAAQQLQLDHQPHLAMAPRKILAALELEAGPVPETGS